MKIKILFKIKNLILRSILQPAGKEKAKVEDADLELINAKKGY